MTLARWLHEGIQQALAELGTNNHLDDEQVHSVRKELKRLRSLLRLARLQMGEALFFAENRSLRDLGRALSSARDAAVLPQAFDNLLEKQNINSKSETQRMRRALRQRAEGLTAAHPLSALALKKLRRALQDTQRRMLLIEWKSDGWKSVSKNLRASYQRGRRAMQCAQTDPSNENLHEWRKQSKHLYHQLQFLEDLWPEPLHRVAQEVHRLNDTLGDDHDLAVLTPALHEFTLIANIEEALEALSAQRQKLQREAFSLGQKIYAEGSRNFVDRLNAYWQAWSLTA